MVALARSSLDRGKKTRDLQGIEIGAGRHCARPCRPEPVIEQFTLSLNDELSPKGTSGQHWHPPVASIERLANHMSLSRLCG